MINIDVSFDIQKATKQIAAVHKKQIPFATAVALTKTANDSRKALEKRTTIDLDRPTNFTKKAFAIKPANKRKLESRVFIKDAQARYLKWQIFGGTRGPAKRSEPVPFNIRLNKFGNIPGRHSGKISKLLARPDTFSGTINNIDGIWQRKNNILKLLIAFEENVKYTKRFKFSETVIKTVKRVFVRRLKLELARAIKTAR